MSRFLEECKKAAPRAGGLIRVSEALDEEHIETIELRPATRSHNTYSVAKTFVATAIGLLYDRGLLRVDDKVTDILKEELPKNGVDERWHDVTVEMALLHRAGLPGGFLDIDVKPTNEFPADFLSYLFTYPLAYTPDTEDRYSDGAYYLLARIAEKLSGKPVDDFLWETLFRKMGFMELAWSHCPMGHVMGATGLYIHSSDMAKLGLLYMNGGTWKGERLLSEEWTRMAMEKDYSLGADESGLIYSKGGMYGQSLMVMPSTHRVVAVQGFEADPGVIREVLREYR